MSNFYWNLKSLRKDLEYDNVTSRRTVATAIVSVLLYLLLVFCGVFESKVGLVSSAVVVGLVMTFSLSVSLYYLKFNKKDYQKSVESEKVLSINKDGLVKVDTHEFSFLNIVKIIETDFKDVTPLNSSTLVQDGKHVGFFVRDLDLKNYDGAVKVVDFTNFDLIYVPLRYVDNPDLLVETLKGKCFDYGVDWDSYIDAVSLGRSIVEMNNESNANDRITV